MHMLCVQTHNTVPVNSLHVIIQYHCCSIGRSTGGNTAMLFLLPLQLFIFILSCSTIILLWLPNSAALISVRDFTYSLNFKTPGTYKERRSLLCVCVCDWVPYVCSTLRVFTSSRNYAA